jgi:endonuclease-3
MTRQEKADRIRDLLEGLYPSPGIPLLHQSPFTLLVAVMLSAQTTDKKVNEVTPALFARASTPEALAEVPVEEIRNIIRTLGLAPQKAKNLQTLSRMLAEKGGEVPTDFASLEALPGIGHKTASVVRAQAFGMPAMPVDTHIHRLANRWGLSNGKNVRRTEEDLKRCFDESIWNKIHLQIIYFGRQHCPALYHDLSTCPICSWSATKKRIAAEARADRDRRRR